jgi:hypothetical protein
MVAVVADVVTSSASVAVTFVAAVAIVVTIAVAIPTGTKVIYLHF